MSSDKKLEKLNKLKESKHFCILPWVGARIETTGKVSPCCRVLDLYSYGNLHQSTFDEIWNNSAIRQMRRDLLNDKALPQCRGCHNIEGPNFPPSFRQDHNLVYDHAFPDALETKWDGSVEKNELLTLDLRFSNICNFRCRSCLPEASTSWYQDYKALYPDSTWKDITYPTQTREELWAMIDSQIPHLRKIYFAGGEPLYHEDHYLLLEKLLEKKRNEVNLVYNSNLSSLTFKKWNVLELWSKFSFVMVGASFDGVGAQAEILRKGTNWEKLERNFEAVRSVVPKENVRIFSTISAMNAFHIPVAIDRWLELGWLKVPGNVLFNIVTTPHRFNLNILSLVERERLKERYANYMHSLDSRDLDPVLVKDIKVQFEVVLNSFAPEVWEQHRASFRDWTKKLDKIRGENFVRLFPELKDIFTDERPRDVDLLLEVEDESISSGKTL